MRAPTAIAPPVSRDPHARIQAWRRPAPASGRDASRGRVPKAASDGAATDQRGHIWRASGREEAGDEFVATEKIRHDVIGSDADEAQALPFIHLCTGRLFAGDADRDAAHVFHFLDFHVAVAEAKKLAADEIARVQNALDQDRLRKALVIVQSAVHAALKILPDLERARFFLHVDFKSFWKAILITRILASADFDGSQFLGFGDGYVEIEEVKNVGGVAVGVASEEPACTKADEWKRLRLIGVGADYIVPNFLCRDELVSSLFPA